MLTGRAVVIRRRGRPATSNFAGMEFAEVAAVDTGTAVLLRAGVLTDRHGWGQQPDRRRRCFCDDALKGRLTGFAVVPIVMEPRKTGRAVWQTTTMAGTKLDIVGNLLTRLSCKVGASVLATEGVLRRSRAVSDGTRLFVDHWSVLARAVLIVRHVLTGVGIERVCYGVSGRPAGCQLREHVVLGSTHEPCRGH